MSHATIKLSSGMAVSVAKSVSAAQGSHKSTCGALPADGTVHASTAHRSFHFTEPVQGGLCIPKQETPRKCTVYAIDPAGQMLVGDVTV